MRKLNQKKAIFLASTFLLVLAGVFLSCSNSSASNNENSTENDEEKLYEITGTIAADYSLNYNSSSRNAISIGNITGGTVTAQEAEVSGSNWTVKSGGKTATGSITTSGSDLVFTIKLLNGKWLLSADCGTYVTSSDEKTKITIDPSVPGEEKAYKDDIQIKVKPKMTAGTSGTVNLTITDSTNTINTVEAVFDDVVLQKMGQTPVNSHTFVFTWDGSTAVPTGGNAVRFLFFTETSVDDTSVPVYSCEEIINVYDNQETNTWVKNSTTNGSSGSSQLHLTVKSESARTVPNEADFILTQDCLDLFKKYYYEVINAAQIKEAVEKIIADNGSDTSTPLANRVEYKIVLLNDITYTNYDTVNLMTATGTGTEVTAFKHAVCLNPSQPLKVSISGKNGVKKLDLNTNCGDVTSTITKLCGIYMNEKVDLTLSNINITRAGTVSSAGAGGSTVEGIGVWRDCKNAGGTWTAGYITLKNKVLVKGNAKNIYFTKTNTGTTTATAPLKIDKSFSTESRIGLSFADTSSTKETPCIVTNGYTNGAGGLFGTDSTIIPDMLFFSDSGYNVYLDDENNEITWNNQGGQGKIDAEMIPDVYFTATGNGDDDDYEYYYGGARYAVDRFLIGYRDTSAYIYVVPYIKVDSNDEQLFIQPDFNASDFTLKLEYENGGVVSVGDDASNPIWKTEAYMETPEGSGTPVQTGLKFSIPGTDNTIPTGRYKLVATVNYNGKQYTEYWDLSYVKLTFSLDKQFIKINSTGDDAKVQLKVTLDDGELRDVTQEAVDNDIGIECHRIKASVSSSSGFSLYDSLEASDTTNKTVTLSDVSLQQPCLFYLNADVDYYGIKCFSELYYNHPEWYSADELSSGAVIRGYINNLDSTFIETLISVDNKKSYYFNPNSSIHTPFNNNNLQSLIDDIQNEVRENQISEAEADYNIYLIGDAVATEETMLETKYKLSSSDSNATDFGKSFISINAYPDAKPIKLRFAIYNTGSDNNKYSIDAKSASGTSGTTLLPAAKKGRAIYIGENADVTFDGNYDKGGIEIKGGYHTNGAAIYLNKNSKLLLNYAIIGKRGSTLFTPDYTDTTYFNSAPDFTDGSGNLITAGSFIKIDSDEENFSSGTKATEFKAYNTLFYGNFGAISAQNGTKFILEGDESTPGSSKATNLNFNYIKTGLLLLDYGSLHNDSYLTNVFFNNNYFVPYSTDTSVSSLIATTSNNLLLNNVHVWNSSYNGIVDGDCRIINCYDGGSVTMNNFHFYMKKDCAPQFNGYNASLSVLYLEDGTANLTDFSVTELVHNPVSRDFTTAYAISASAGSSGTCLDKINVSGKFYTDGRIYLQKPYTSGATSSGVFFNIAEPIELYTANDLYSINKIGNSNTQYTADPTTFGTIILHTDSTNPANGYVAGNATNPGSSVLSGEIKNVKACFNKFAVKLTGNIEKSLNERGQLQ